MKLLIKDYLASLRERGELDAILPDLLSELGFTVYSRPSIGTRQYGVDMAAVGVDDDGVKKLFLFSIKAGDLKRADWDSGPQSLRPSLNEIRDVYIKSRIPPKYSDLPVVICLCFGGDMDENIRDLVTGYITDNQTDKIEYQEWNGDKIAGLLLTGVLREELLPKHARSLFRKSVAMLDEPDASYLFFCKLIRLLIFECKGTQKARVTVARQINICLWILYVWSREAENLESPYRSSEFAVLHVWALTAAYLKKKTAPAKAMRGAMDRLVKLHVAISQTYATQRILPHTDKRHGLSTAVNSMASLDVNLKLFDVLGRLSLCGLWLQYLWTIRDEPTTKDEIKHFRDTINIFVSGLINFVDNNPILLTPIQDEQAIDINLACLFLSGQGQSGFVRRWIAGIARAAVFAFKTHDKYPCLFSNYQDLLVHPKERSDAYRNKATEGSILYPTLAVWAGLLCADDVLSTLQNFAAENLQHCTLQLWFPGHDSEKHLYTNGDKHGGALTGLEITADKEALLDQVFEECEADQSFNQLSAIQFGIWPLILMACRHYRLPIPPHFWLEFRDAT